MILNQSLNIELESLKSILEPMSQKLNTRLISGKFHRILSYLYRLCFAVRLLKKNRTFYFIYFVSI